MNVNMENSPVAQDAPAAAGRSPEVDTASIRPIILVGLARSGTKWVSNIIASHEDVVAVQSTTAGGILETDMFEGLRDKFDLGFPTDYIGLIELWSRTEFFRLAGGDPEKFYRLDPRPRSPFAVFDLLMSDFARRHRCGHWLQKTSPLNALDVLDYFRSAKVVVVRRDLLDNVRSALALRARHGVPPRPAWTTCHIVYQRKLLDRICSRYRAVEIRYEDLKADPEREKARLFAELGLAPPKNPKTASFPRNTSFASENQREQILSGREAALVKSVAAIVGALPLPVISAVIALRRVFRRPRPRPLVSGSFGEVEDRLVDRSRGAAGAGD